jgi:hypothetical protein
MNKSKGGDLCVIIKGGENKVVNEYST